MMELFLRTLKGQIESQHKTRIGIKFDPANKAVSFSMKKDGLPVVKSQPVPMEILERIFSYDG